MNTRTERLTIITNEPCKVVVNKDSLNFISTEHKVLVNRSKDSLFISAFNEKNKRTIGIKPGNSLAYWLNLYSYILWTGFLIDKNNPKRYCYPSIVYFDLNSKNNYLKYKPLDHLYSSILKITPLRAVGITNAGLEISYERKFSNYFTTQIAGVYLFQNSVWDLNDRFNTNLKGFQVAIEEKFYLKKSAPVGPYISLELSYLRNQYKDIWNFGSKDIYSDTTYRFTNYTDTFGVKKQTFSINFKVGHQFFIKRISFDFYVGLGIRYKDVTHFDRKNPNDEMEAPRHPNVHYITDLNGKYWTVSFPLNFRIGWTF